MIRIAHLADLHFGKQGLRVLSEEGLNQREIDLYDLSDVLSAQLVNMSLDLVVIAGDLYDRKYPKPIAIQRCHRFLQVLRQASLPVLIIGGNHDHKNSNQPSPLLLAQEFLGCELFLSQGHWDFRGVRFHCLPYEAVAELSRKEDATLEEFEWGACNILVAHAYADGKNISSPPEDVKVPPAVVHDHHFSGVLLGHVHEHAQLDPGGNAYYPGAIDRLTFKEANQTPSFWLHQIEPESSDAQTSHPPLMVSETISIGDGMDQGPRPFVGLLVEQDQKTMEELDRLVRRKIKELLSDPRHTGAVIMVKVREADPQLRASDYRQQWLLYARSKGAIWLELDAQTKALRELMDADFEDLTDTEQGTLQQRWRDFLKEQGHDDLLPLAQSFYERAQEKRKQELSE